MSYFKSRTSESRNTDNNDNTCISSRNTFASSASVKPLIYNYQDELFPELTTSNKGAKVTKDNSSNYASAAATISITTIKKAYEVPADKTEYTYNKTTGKTTVAYGKKSNSELERDKQIKLENDPKYVAETILKELSDNWKRYKIEYNKIHGQDAYDNLHYTDPIYPTSDEEYSDSERENEYYSN